MIPLNVRHELREGRYERSDAGIIVPRAGMLVEGRFHWRRNGWPYGCKRNLLTDEGIALVIADTQPSPLYCALFADDVTPLKTWTGATFDAVATEINSTTDGYAETTRPVLVADAVTASEFNIRTTGSPLQICGFGVLSGDVIGSTSDVLMAAIRLSEAPELYDDHDILDVYYSYTAVPIT